MRWSTVRCMVPITQRASSIWRCGTIAWSRLPAASSRWYEKRRTRLRATRPRARIPKSRLIAAADQCPSCRGCDQIPRRSEMTRYATKRHSLRAVRTPSNGLAKSVARLYPDVDWPNASTIIGEAAMLRLAWRTVSTLIVFGLLILAQAPARAADAEIDSLLRSPIGKDWVT